jgi:hypothetical protein
MPNYQGVWSLSEQYQNASGWPTAPLPAGTGLFIGGSDGSGSVASIDFLSIATTGNATDFGDFGFGASRGASCSSSTRAFYFAGQRGNSYTNDIAFITYVIGSATIDFGDQTHENGYASDPAALSSATRGVVAGGDGSNSPYYLDKIQYITMASEGNSTDFGDLTVARSGLSGLASSTRGVFSGGRQTGGSISNVIDYITIASTGNATDFGDSTYSRRWTASVSSSTRGVTAGGSDGANRNIIDYITIASTGNAADFGDLSVTRSQLAGCSSSTRGVFGGGNTGSDSNVIDYVEIASTGNATDFGDLTAARKYLQGCSNSHGGLS